MPDLAPLPDVGTLLVFWSERYFEFERMDFRIATRVFWLPDDTTPVLAQTPETMTAYPPIALTGVLMPVLGELEHIQAPDDDQEAIYNADDELMHIYDHHLLGSSRDVQGPVLDEISYWFDQGFPQTREDFTADELDGNDWTLLAQINSTGTLCFGDGGALYLVIPHADLQAHRFDRAVGIMQCS